MREQNKQDKTRHHNKKRRELFLILLSPSIHKMIIQTKLILQKISYKIFNKNLTILRSFWGRNRLHSVHPHPSTNLRGWEKLEFGNFAFLKVRKFSVSVWLSHRGVFLTGRLLPFPFLNARFEIFSPATPSLPFFKFSGSI